MVGASASPWGTVSAERLRLNPFRVLGLGLDATPAQIRRASERIVAARRLGSGSAPASVLPLPGPVDEAAVRDAAHQLRDPALRLLAEAFWFQPDPGPEPAQWSLDAGQDLPSLRQAWYRVSEHEDAGDRQVAARHNLEVMALIQALDAFGPNAPVPAPDPPDDGWWSEALDTWAEVLKDGAEATRVRRRAGELGLSAADLPSAAQFTGVLGRAVVDPLVEQTIRELDAGRGQDPDDVIEDLVYVELPEGLGEEAVHQLVRHADERIRAIADPGWARVRRDPATSREVAEELIATLDRPLALLAAADSEDLDLGLSQRAHDDVATTLAACAARVADLEPHYKADAVRYAERGLALAVSAEAQEQTATVFASLSDVRITPRQGPTAAQAGLPLQNGYPLSCVECGRQVVNENTLNVPVFRPDGSRTERELVQLPFCGRCGLRALLLLPLILARTIGLWATLIIGALTIFTDLSSRWLWYSAAAWVIGTAVAALRRRYMGARLSVAPQIRQALAEGWRPAPGWGIHE